jgi:hypothetical protein
MSRRLIKITLGILLGFLLVSFAVYKVHRNFVTTSLHQNETLTKMGNGAETVDGKVQSIDLNKGILCLVGHGQKFDFAFDGATVFVEGGRAIHPETINSGNSVTVIFFKRVNRNFARNILLYEGQ